MAAALQRTTLDGTLAADAYRSLADLLGFPLARLKIVGGFIHAITNGATMRMVPRGGQAPATVAAGTPIPAGNGVGIQLSDEFRLDEVWVRNTTAGANATLVFTGTLQSEA